MRPCHIDAGVIVSLDWLDITQFRRGGGETRKNPGEYLLERHSVGRVEGTDRKALLFEEHWHDGEGIDHELVAIPWGVIQEVRML